MQGTARAPDPGTHSPTDGGARHAGRVAVLCQCALADGIMMGGKGVALLVAVAAAAIGALHLRDEACLETARSRFDAARKLEQTDPARSVELYLQAVEERGRIRLPWSNWRVATHAHANAAQQMLRLGRSSWGPDKARSHAEVALLDEPSNRVALGAVADSLAQSGRYPAALPYLARIDADSGRPTPYVDATGQPTFTMPSNTASILPTEADGIAVPADVDMAALRRFDTWLRENGARISPNMRLSFDAKGDGSGLRGIVATADVHHREMLLQIPLRCTLAALSGDHNLNPASSAIGSSSSSQLADLFARKIGEQVPGLHAALEPTPAQLKRGRPSAMNIELILRLLRELGDTQSFYGPYIATLPSSFAELPVFWSSEQRSELRNTNLALEVEAVDEELRALFMQLHHPTSPVCSLLTTGQGGGWSGSEALRAALAAPGNGTPSVCGEAAFRWAYAVVSSRAFSPALLVPVQDLLNHVDGTLTQYGFERPGETVGTADGTGGETVAEGFVNLYAPTSVKAGGELVQSYQNQDNDRGALKTAYSSGCHFLMHYGFLPNDLVEAALPTPEFANLDMAGPSSSLGMRRNLLQMLGLPTPVDGEAGEDTASVGVAAPIPLAGADGLAAFSIQEAPATMSQQHGVRSEEAVTPRDETALLCTLRIRRLPVQTLATCAQHGSIRACCTATAAPEVETAVWLDYAAMAELAHSLLGNEGEEASFAPVAQRYRGNLRRFLRGLEERARSRAQRVHNSGEQSEPNRT